MRVKLLAVMASLLVVAAACGDDSSSELTVEEYATLLQAVETSFQEESPDPLGDADSRDRYPVGGDLVAATELYTAIDERLAGWKALQPPPEFSEAHARLVSALDALQEEVGSYLMDEALEGEAFDFDTIAPLVRAEIRAAAEACRALRAQLLSAGVPIVFSGDCQF